MDNPNKSSGKISVSCDLFLDLKFYNIPPTYLEELKSKHPEIIIKPVNCKSYPIYDADSEIYWGNRITPDIIECMPNLKWIHFGSVGVNRAQTDEILERDIVITNSKGLLTNAMVTSATSYITSLARSMHFCQVLRNKRKLNREAFDEKFDEVSDLYQDRCLIVGYGEVGKRLARVVDSLGMNVDCISKSMVSDSIVFRSYRLANLKNAVKEADFVVNLLPHNKDTTRVFTEQIFKSMKSSSFFINLGRGETVDEEHLVKALQHKWIRGAAVDVFEKEPLPQSSPLWSCENTIITPHIAGLTNKYWPEQIRLFEYNLEKYKDGNYVEMKNIVPNQTIF